MICAREENVTPDSETPVIFSAPLCSGKQQQQQQQQ
jgi:hypothetical protein